MKKLYLTALIFSGVGACFCQQLLWAGTVAANPDPDVKSLASDDDGNVYYYGTLMLQGSRQGFISKYSSGGGEVFTINLSDKVWPQSVTPGPQGRMYVAGRFSGQVTIGNFNFKSQGACDGFVACLNGSGFDWVSVLDGSREDDARSVVYNPVTNHLLVTGSIRSSFSFNSKTHEIHPEGALFLAEVDLSGDLMRYKLHDFRANDTTGNVGLEVHADNDGNYYLLHRREGVPWYNTTVTGPADGTYLSRLNASLDPHWSNFIINSSCYYGKRCSGMTCTGGGESYVPSYCRGKYGGDGRIGGFSADGASSFSLSNQDGFYAELASDGLNVYAVGTESANGCPCESNFPGYRVVRKIEPSGAQTVLMVLGHTIVLSNVAVSKNGMVFVRGYFSAPQAQVGSFTLINGNSSSGVQHFMMAFASPRALTAVSGLPNDLFSVYPNPAQQELCIEVAAGACEVEITSMLGEKIRVYQLNDKAARKVHVADLPRGICIITVVQGSRRQAKTVILN